VEKCKVLGKCGSMTESDTRANFAIIFLGAVAGCSAEMERFRTETGNGETLSQNFDDPSILHNQKKYSQLVKA
jgi:hypothetical protein